MWMVLTKEYIDKKSSPLWDNCGKNGTSPRKWKKKLTRKVTLNSDSLSASTLADSTIGSQYTAET